MKKYLAAGLILLSVSIFALQWPVSKPVVIATFGESRGNNYHTGIDIGGGEQQVLAAADGEIVYYQEESDIFPALPSGLGSFVVIEHDRQLRTTYAHLKDGSIPKNRVKFASGDVIGMTGDSGAANGQHLYFEVTDRELNEIVNPLILLPAAPDRTKPVIRDVLIKNSLSHEYEKLVHRGEIKSGKTDVSAVIYDTSSNVNYFRPVAPYRINVYINGEESASIVYSSIKKSGNNLSLGNNPRSPGDYYLDEKNWQVYLGQFDIKAGTTRIEITAGDYAGNETEREYTVISK